MAAAPGSTSPDILTEIETAAATLLAGGPQLFTDIATGTGGLPKIVKVGGDLLNLLSLFHSAIGSHPAVSSS